MRDPGEWLGMQMREKVGVEIAGATKRYGKYDVLSDVSLSVAPGEFVSLLGPSGSGKSTLLGILGGFVAPTAGSVHIGGQDVTFAPPHKRDIGVVFQNYALFPHLTVGENVAFPLRARRQPKADWPAKVRDALAMVELSGYEDRRISAMSGGQRQRVALARAIVFEPRLILMDEPLSALDKQLRETMQIELRELHEKLGSTTIYVTHDQREALTMSDRVAILKDGRLVQIDAPQRLHDHPADAFVAGFIGEATLIPATRIDASSVEVAGAVIRTARAIPQTGTILLAVHTEKLLVDDGSRADANRLHGTVRSVVYQGESLRVLVDLGGGHVVSLRQPSHHHGRAAIPEPGRPIALTLHPEDAIVVPEARA
ncbi:ABC transporter ATP-binding protein [Aureimonas sp. AU12]|uniref:ABC transporter ATP-binding protein n=1 Tax=Aureimonas sp. AU12 TaxID=1638161 RepID=UPI001FCCF97B|nr:ABC transporter ATP-binding protein [Aureimonas sp. AU12]